MVKVGLWLLVGGWFEHAFWNSVLSRRLENGISAC